MEKIHIEEKCKYFSSLVSFRALVHVPLLAFLGEKTDHQDALIIAKIKLIIKLMHWYCFLPS